MKLPILEEQLPLISDSLDEMHIVVDTISEHQLKSLILSNIYIDRNANNENGDLIPIFIKSLNRVAMKVRLDFNSLLEVVNILDNPRIVKNGVEKIIDENLILNLIFWGDFVCLIKHSVKVILLWLLIKLI